MPPRARSPMRAIAAHRRSYAHPIAFRRGEAVQLTGREDDWHGHRWVWAIGPDGREGWIPPQTVAAGADGTFACVDYSAAELTVAAGETVWAAAAQLGWRWCRNGLGEEGWLPCEVLAEIA